ncbi:serine protease HtrA [Alkaliphilus peptidifermentans]|uniref:Serine protease, S1-C subfamily, contains C-terminal PDZ domain n=1 Tax=Alkaliphilus peptidifermentans DSM 18978 TaxID=1120976 RepID=A0A1G5HCB2_9FIRM|nr:trypsin-like peptidase domain-containing protein [Alkaliphilus peptidifermentans]SCY61505.1 serine protease, S1-C subfamily, contains C-terminal PDZ domain [Alkaliphilus peptidifermentans DSM 18978]
MNYQENDKHEDNSFEEEEKHPIKTPSTESDQQTLYNVSRYDDNKPEKPKPFRYFKLVLIGALLGGAISSAITYYYLPEIMALRGVRNFEGQSIVIEPQQDLTVYSAVARKAMPSVVGITTVALERDAFFGTQRRSTGLGTGVIVDERGYILTNSHVVGDGNVEEIIVILYDGEKVPAKVVWNERSLDLAVIKVEAIGLPVAELGDSDNLEVGEIAIAIGNPLGLNFERTLTQGVISGLNRVIPLEGEETIENLIQTDASINPGNSGGPLLNGQGQVIGINTAKIRTGEGLGFAIPINTAKPIVDQIIEQGEFTRVYIGIRGVNIDVFERATGTSLQADNGVYIAEVLADSPAEAADLRTGDVIIKIQGIEVRAMGSLQRELYRYRPGDEVTVTILRNGREENVQIVFN